MKKVLKELRKKLPAIALAVIMCMGTAISAFAAGDAILGTPEAPAQAAITKKLIMPEGTTTPGAIFTFQIDGVKVDDSTDPTEVAKIPLIPNATLSFDSSDSGNTDNVSHTKAVLKQTSDLLDSINFPHAGVYVYRVTEIQSVTGYVPEANEHYEYSIAEYELSIFVKEGPSGTLYVAGVGTVITEEDSSNGSSNVNDKVDATPKPGDPNTTGVYSKMIFTNIYTKTAGGTNPENTANSALTISKAVDKDYADKSKYFVFNVDIAELDSILNTGGSSVTYRAYVVDSLSGATVTDTPNYANLETDSTGAKFIEITAGTTIAVNLKHNQKLVFTDLTVGAAFTVEEDAVPNYVATYLQTVNNGTPTAGNSNTVENLACKTTSALIGEGTNRVAFTNNYRTITPTGVIVNNLPFVMILILAAGSFIAFVLVKSRKKHSRV